MEKGIDVAHLAEWWMDREAEIHLAIPNGDLTFYAMVIMDKDGELISSYPSAYPFFVWEKLGWERLGKY